MEREISRETRESGRERERESWRDKRVGERDRVERESERPCEGPLLGSTQSTLQLFISSFFPIGVRESGGGREDKHWFHDRLSHTNIKDGVHKHRGVCSMFYLSVSECARKVRCSGYQGSKTSKASTEGYLEVDAFDMLDLGALDRANTSLCVSLWMRRATVCVGDGKRTSQ